MIIRCSYKPHWTLPSGDTEESYEAAKKALAAQSATGWEIWQGGMDTFAATNPPGWCPGIFTDNHRKKENLLSAQLIGVDYDDYADETELLEHPVIARHALYIGHTPSHGQPWRTGARLRVVFCLDGVIDTPTDKLTIAGRYEMAVLALLHKLPSGYDESCKDASRFFFGCKDIIRSYPSHILYMSDVYKWHSERLSYETVSAPTIATNGKLNSTDKKRAYAERKLDEFIGQLALAGKGTRNDTLNKTAVQVYGLVKEGALDRGKAESAMRQTAQAIGLKDSEITATLKSAYDAAEVWDLPGFDNERAKSEKSEIPVSVATELKQAAQATRDMYRATQVIPEQDIKQMIRTLQALLPTCKQEPPVSGTMAAKETVLEILSRVGKDPLEGTLKTGIPELDQSIRGIRPRWTYSIYGAPGMGKSTLSVSIASALIDQEPGLIASTESYYKDWVTKLIAFRTGIPVDRLIEGRITPKEQKYVTVIGEQLERASYTLLPIIAPTIDDIENEIKNGRYSYKWLLVDSIQKVSVPQSTGIYDRTAFASNNLQRIAVENNIAVISTTQVDRLIDRRTNKMPQASDAYGGAPVQQDSDVIISLYYHQHYVTTGQAEPLLDFPEGTALARIVKARWTASHSGLPLKFVGGVGFYPLADERDIPPLPYRRDVDNVQQVDFLDSVPEKTPERIYE